MTNEKIREGFPWIEDLVRARRRVSRPSLAEKLLMLVFRLFCRMGSGDDWLLAYRDPYVRFTKRHEQRIDALGSGLLLFLFLAFLVGLWLVYLCIAFPFFRMTFICVALFLVLQHVVSRKAMKSRLAALDKEFIHAANERAWLEFKTRLDRDSEKLSREGANLPDIAFRTSPGKVELYITRLSVIDRADGRHCFELLELTDAVGAATGIVLRLCRPIALAGKGENGRRAAGDSEGAPVDSEDRTVGTPWPEALRLINERWADCETVKGSYEWVLDREAPGAGRSGPVHPAVTAAVLLILFIIMTFTFLREPAFRPAVDLASIPARDLPPVLATPPREGEYVLTIDRHDDDRCYMARVLEASGDGTLKVRFTGRASFNCDIGDGTVFADNIGRGSVMLERTDYAGVRRVTVLGRTEQGARVSQRGEAAREAAWDSLFIPIRDLLARSPRPAPCRVSAPVRAGQMVLSRFRDSDFAFLGRIAGDTANGHGVRVDYLDGTSEERSLTDLYVDNLSAGSRIEIFTGRADGVKGWVPALMGRRRTGRARVYPAGQKAVDAVLGSIRVALTHR